MWTALLDWIDSRTGIRALRAHALDEPLPPGTGWLFTTGSVVALLIGCQVLTGVGLSIYYVPSPALAYDSLRYLMSQVPLGALLRGLHFWGASFIVVSAVVHLLRVFLTGSYKAPREVTWMTGLALLLVILGFSLSGYLLPWDQKAYWATTVTISVAESSPVIGGFLANVLRGGDELGALTLGRWYAAHVFLLPGALLVFLVAHIALMRKHGISGPISPQAGAPVPFYPWHVAKDTLMMAAVFAALFAAALLLPAHLDEIANPADADYIPRPEWYFLSLFQLLKYFPGPLEVVATQVVPGVVVGGMFALPFLDRGPNRHPWAPSRRVFTLLVASVGGGIVTLTVLGLRDAPVRFDPNVWGPQSVAGYLTAEGQENPCARCHVEGEPMLDEDATRAVLAYLRRLRAGAAPPQVPAASARVVKTLGTRCVACHRLDGDGGDTGPDLTHIGARRDAEAIRRIVTDPNDEYGDSMMPVYGPRLDAGLIAGIGDYLAAKK